MRRLPPLNPCLVRFTLTLAITALITPLAHADLPRVTDAEIQPLLVQVGRLREALEFLGTPLSDEASQKLDAAQASLKEPEVLKLVQEALDPLCLAGVVINPESRVKVDPGPAPRILHEAGWTQFLVKVHNEAGVTVPLEAFSTQGLPVSDGFAFSLMKKKLPRPESIKPEEVRDRWLDLQMFDGRPLAPTLSGVKLEYRIVQLYSRDAGKRSAVLAFDVGQGTQDVGFRNDITLTFDALPSTPVTLGVRDENGEPTIASFQINDVQGRVYPSQIKRLEPDFAFHPQVYRADQERVLLPAGKYTIKVERGPEYLPEVREVEIGDQPVTLDWRLQRWINPSLLGWWSGDHHIHAAGCSHYSSPTEGVHPETMVRHIIGEDLKVGANLTWGPCFDYQKQFFTGKVDNVSKYPYLLRYDVEVSGFGSHNSGHLVLLGLKEQIFPGGESKDHWPTLCLNTLRWAKKQGAICGPAHSGWGLEISSSQFPTDELPSFGSIGAMEYIVDVTHLVEGPDGKMVPAVDFMSTVDTPYHWELNCWYHTLNAGYRTRISGETDFPCIYDDKVGMGRSYVKLDGDLTYEAWCDGIQKGRCYVGEGRSHLIDFKVNDQQVGLDASEIQLDKPGTVTVTADVAAYIPAEPEMEIAPFPERGWGIWALNARPMWHLERGRIQDTRDVKVELVVNGFPVGEKIITADGELQQITFENVQIDKSSWVALRVPYSSHTNPIWVMVGDKPVRPHRKSLEWCLKAVDKVWSQKERFIAKAEMDDALAAYQHARDTYRQRLEECE